MAKKKKENKSENPVDNFKKQLQDRFGKDSGAFIKDVDNIHIEKIPTGSLELNIALKGGFPRGKIAELYGYQQSGKSTTCIETVREFQKLYPSEQVLWIDLEDVFDKEYFELLGVDINRNFILSRPKTGEQAYEIMLSFSKEIGNGIIILDSFAMLLPEKEDAGDFGDAVMGSQARLNSHGLRKLHPYTAKSNTTVLMINQQREKIGVLFGSPDTTTGGKSLPHYARTRLGFSKVKGANPKIATGCNIKLEKANYGHEGEKVETHLLKTGGIDICTEVIKIAEQCGIFEKSGYTYSYGDTKLGQGFDNTREFLLDNPEFKEEVIQKIKVFYNI